ncbi:MAG: DUF4465 domain-containing protein [Opitutae bacterium]|nr:DUF4465 domain-containing protein [Opitutae bacterium]
MRRSYWFLWVLFLGLPAFAAQTTVSFDGLLPLPNEYVNDVSATDEAATFVNTCYFDWGAWYWAGFAFSTVSNTADGTYGNQYAAAQARSGAYAVAYDDGGYHPAPEILLDLPAAPKSVLVNNTAYAAYVIRNSNEYARAFTTNDTFILTLTARNLAGEIVATTNHYLADFRDGKTLIQTNWSTLDLSWMPPEVVSIVGTLTTTDMSYGWPNTPMYFALADFTYAYAGLDSGIAATNPAFRCWANGVADYAPGPNVSNQFLLAANALGPASNDVFAVACLGDNGWITLTFPAPITDGPGPDFAVFENSVWERFLELATVEVSSDGAAFTAFPCHTLSTNPVSAYATNGVTESGAFGNLAGKHLLGTGTPFDLRELAGTPGLDVRRVTHVRIRDLLGDGSNRDSYGNPIYDPTPTYGTGGFDLDAVGVLNANVDISTDPNAPAPALDGYHTLLEYKATLDAPAWTTDAPPQGAPGFFRYRLVK